jgi:hypothetical protein
MWDPFIALDTRFTRCFIFPDPMQLVFSAVNEPTLFKFVFFVIVEMVGWKCNEEPKGVGLKNFARIITFGHASSKHF